MAELRSPDMRADNRTDVSSDMRELPWQRNEDWNTQVVPDPRGGERCEGPMVVGPSHHHTIASSK